MKGSKTYSILHQKCPRCQEGNLFNARAYNVKRMLDMPSRCPVCGQNFEMEPGFYSGALWVSFPLLVLLVLPFWAVLYFLLSLSFEWMALIIGVYIFGLQPVIMRYSRAIWINVFVSYDPEATKEQR